MKSSKKVALRKLHGALKSILDTSDDKLVSGKRDKGVAEILPAAVTKERKTAHTRVSRKKSPDAAGEKRGGLTYILSRDQQLIPVLTDDEIMERHKLADENMKRVWTSIIDKYESVEDQGDVVDLRTGEVVEDHGHLRGLSGEHAQGSAPYQSTLKNLLGVQDEENASRDVWQDGDEEDSEDEDYNSEDEARQEADSESDSQVWEYEKMLMSKIRD